MTLVMISAAASAQEFKYRFVPPVVVEKRLRMFEGNNHKRHDTLKALFEQVGCTGEDLKDAPVKNETIPNVVCILKGASDRVIIVGAHFDMVDAGSGVVDNWSGASLLPSIYDGLKAHPRDHTFIFIGFTQEEKGLIGSEDYANKMTKEQIAKTDAMINMDTLGLGPTAVWGNRADKRLTKDILNVAATMEMKLRNINFETIGSTDSESFARKKIPVLTVHSITPQTDKYLHSPDDKIEHIDIPEHYKTYKLVTKFLAYIDKTIEK
ncbi:MAG TPA: M28 family peptidase [Terriglobales bacterium]|nr:M28 family peptidase [Terriglobales bacterium]